MSVSRTSIQTLEDAGFSDPQIQALIEIFSPMGHAHEIQDIIGLEEHLEGDEEDLDDDEE